MWVAFFADDQAQKADSGAQAPVGPTSNTTHNNMQQILLPEISVIDMSQGEGKCQ